MNKSVEKAQNIREKFFSKGSDGLLHCKAKPVDTTVDVCKKTFSLTISSTNLKYHLIADHGIIFEKKKENVGQTSIIQFFSQPLGEEAKKGINTDLINLIVKQNLPLSIVETETLRNFCGKLNSNYKLPDRGTIRNWIIEYAGIERKRLNDLLKNIDFISISSDLWVSDKKEPYIGINLHYCSDFIILQRNLCTKFIPFPHTTEFIGNAIMEELDNYNIRGKVKYVVTDNASNMIGIGKFINAVPINCAVHTIQLTVTIFMEYAKPLLDKIRNLVRFFRSSPKQIQLLKDYQKLIDPESNIYETILDCETRWNSTYEMIQRIFKLFPAISTMAVTYSQSSQSEEKKNPEKN